MKKYRIVIHCSATPFDMDYTEEDLLRDHLARGFNTYAGYHIYIRKSGDKKYKRPMHIIGAHALPFNKDSWGICYEGGLKAGGKTWRDAADTRTMQQRAELLNAIREVMEYIVSTVSGVHKKDYIIEIIGHGQLEGIRKECPCFDAKLEYEWITA